MRKHSALYLGTFAALSILGASALNTASAADVQVYGLIDMGLNYGHIDQGNGVEEVDKFEMASGSNSMSRFGLKGEEDLGNGLKLGFVLENGFTIDDGAFQKAVGAEKRLFGREAQVNLSGRFGIVKFGRMGALLSGYNTTGLFGGKVSPFSTTWNFTPGHKTVMTGDFLPYDNMVTYTTPEFAGFKLHAQYSFGTDTTKYAADAVEGKASVDRWTAAALSYEKGPAHFVFIASISDWANTANAKNMNDGLQLTTGGAYDFGVLKLYLDGQYFEHQRALGIAPIFENISKQKLGLYNFGSDGLKGTGLNAGVAVPAFGGTAKANIGWMSAENEADTDFDIDRKTFSLGWETALSKRTTFYTSGGIIVDSYGGRYTIGDESGKLDDAKQYGWIAGLIHRF